MTEFVQLWVYLSSTPLFGLAATLAVYVVAVAVYDRLGRAPLANPVLWSVTVLGLVLSLTGISYPSYFAGAQFIHVLLGPAVVALAWPLWTRLAEVRRHALRLGLASLAGGVAASGSAIALGLAFGLGPEVTRSLAVKSVTTPVAMGMAERIGGSPALAAVFAIVSGIVGAVSAKYLFGLLRIVSMRARGFSLGTTSHGIGAARAIQVDPDAGAYAGIALGLQVLIAPVVVPLLVRLFGL